MLSCCFARGLATSCPSCLSYLIFQVPIHFGFRNFFVLQSFYSQIQATRISPRGYDALCLPPVPKATRPITSCQPALTTRLVSRVYLLFSKSSLQDGQRVAKTTEPSGPLSTLSPPIASAPSQLLSQVPKRPIHNPILPSLTLTQCHRKTIKNEKLPLQPLPQGSAEEWHENTWSHLLNLRSNLRQKLMAVAAKADHDALQVHLVLAGWSQCSHLNSELATISLNSLVAIRCSKLLSTSASYRRLTSNHVWFWFCYVQCHFQRCNCHITKRL